MEFAALAMTVALLWKAVDAFKQGVAGQWINVATQAAVWVFGVLLAFLLAATDFAQGVIINEIALSDFNAASIVFFGLGLGSSASVGVDLKKAHDNTDSAHIVSISEAVVARKAA